MTPDRLRALAREDYQVIAEAVEDFLGFDVTTRKQQDRIVTWAKEQSERTEPPVSEGQQDLSAELEMTKAQLRGWRDFYSGQPRELPRVWEGFTAAKDSQLGFWWTVGYEEASEGKLFAEMVRRADASANRSDAFAAEIVALKERLVPVSEGRTEPLILATIDGRCGCESCKARTENIYRMVGVCLNCGGKPILMLFRQGDPSVNLTCPLCGKWHGVQAQRRATDDEIPASVSEGQQPHAHEENEPSPSPAPETKP